jgi:hypothetical protein
LAVTLNWIENPFLFSSVVFLHKLSILWLELKSQVEWYLNFYTQFVWQFEVLQEFLFVCKSVKLKTGVYWL